MYPTILTPADRLILTTRLDDARAQFHQLVTGTAARVIVDQNGERVEFTAANKGVLSNYIMSLEAQLAVVPAASRVLGPARFIF